MDQALDGRVRFPAGTSSQAALQDRHRLSLQPAYAVLANQGTSASSSGYTPPGSNWAMPPASASSYTDAHGVLVHSSIGRPIERSSSIHPGQAAVYGRHYNALSPVLSSQTYWHSQSYQPQSYPSTPYTPWSRPNSAHEPTQLSATISASQLARLAGDRRGPGQATPPGTATSSSLRPIDESGRPDSALSGHLWPPGGIFGPESHSSIATSPDESMSVDSVGPSVRRSVEPGTMDMDDNDEDDEDEDGFGSSANLSLTPMSKRMCYNCKKKKDKRDKKFTWRRSSLYPDKIVSCLTSLGIRRQLVDTC